jgi:hypothetical protein
MKSFVTRLPSDSGAKFKPAILPSLLFRQKEYFLYTKVNSDLVCSKDLAWYGPSMHSGNVCAVILFMGYHGTFVILTGVSEHS